MICQETGYNDANEALEAEAERASEFDAIYPEMTDEELDAMLAAGAPINFDDLCLCEEDKLCAHCSNVIAAHNRAYKAAAIVSEAATRTKAAAFFALRGVEMV